MSKNTIAGTVQETGGKIRAKVDHALGDTEGEMLGIKDQVAGNVKKNFGKMEDALKNNN